MNTIKVLPVSDAHAVRPLWSVMIPTYNCAHFLTTTLQSVLRQDRGTDKMEIWVVDDCSTDNPGDIVEQLGKERIQFYRQQQNVGQLNNFSTCLNLSKGRLIHLLHGDDFVHDGFYESLESPLMSDSSIGAGFTRHSFVNVYGKVSNVSELLMDKAGVIEDFISIIASKQLIQTPSIVVKREAYEKLGAFNRDLTWVEDWEMWIRIASHFKFYYEPRNLASYRIHYHSNSENSYQSGRFIRDVHKCIGIYSKYLNMNEIKKRQITIAAKQHFLNLALRQGRDRASLPILWQSFSFAHTFSEYLKIIFLIILTIIPYLYRRLRILYSKVKRRLLATEN